MNAPQGPTPAVGDTLIFPAKPDPLSFITLNADNTVTVVSKHMEMGQGVFTGLATLVAEELDADRAQIRVVNAPVGAAYGNLLMGGGQGTGGQTSMQSSYMLMRSAGAAMRQMLVAAAAQRWSIAPEGIDVQAGVVSERAGARRATFGELAVAAMVMPVPAEVVLKDPSRFVYIGKDFARLDVPDKVRGKATYTQDLQLSGMMTAVIARPPRIGSVLSRFDASAALAVPGVLHVVAVDAGVAVVATDFWTALQGREKLQIDWDESKAFRKSSADIYAELHAVVQGQPSHIAVDKGDVKTALEGAAQRFDASFQIPYHAHATMETMNIIVQLKDGELHAWGGLQMVSMDQYQMSQAAGVPPPNFKLHMQITGGSFGRRATPHSVPGIEAISIAKALQTDKPVKLMYDRSDDMASPSSYYRPAFVHRIEAGLDAAGNLVAWRHRSAGQSILIGTLMEKDMVHDSVDFLSVEGGIDQPYQVPNFHMAVENMEYPIRTSWLRTSGTFHNGFAHETMMDEVAKAAGRDPLEFRLALLDAQARARPCLELAAEKAGWRLPLASATDGGRRGRGLAVVPAHRSHAAAVIEVTVAADGKSYRIDRVVIALDCGTVINPDNVMSQIEGSVGFGLSLAREGQITFTDGQVDQKFYSDYMITRMHTMPPVEAYIVPSVQGPSGASETAAAVIAPALANALFAATGQVQRTVPLRLEGQQKDHWLVPDKLNTFAGATDWAPPAGWKPISVRE